MRRIDRSNSKGKSKKGGDLGREGMHERVRSAKGRKISSTRWLERQLNDPYVQQAKALGYRSRAAFKLIELDDRFRFLKRGAGVLDLGSAPGGWSQIASDRVGPEGIVLAVDILEMDNLSDVEFMQLDFTEFEAVGTIRGVIRASGLDGMDVVLSDMAPATTGHRATDHVRIVSLCHTAFDFALEVLNPDGTFVAKVLQGGAEGGLLTRMKAHFKTVRHAKPKSSRPESAETYVVASGFRREVS